MVKQIPLSGKKGSGKFTLVDDDLFDVFSEYTWYYSKGYVAGDSKVLSDFGNRALHRIVNKTPHGMATDHADRNPLNNQRCNLRTATARENAANTEPRSIANKTSKYKGVHWVNEKSLWASRIMVDGEIISLGYYRTPEDAAIAYDVAARNYNGIFAYFNFPDTDQSKNFKQRRLYRGGTSQYTGVSYDGRGYVVSCGIGYNVKYCGFFYDERFAAMVYDAHVIQTIGHNSASRVNFPELINTPLDLTKRYVFKCIPEGQYPYTGITPHRKRWAGRICLNGKRYTKIFLTPEMAAEYYDKMILMHKDEFAIYLNFPEKIHAYVTELGNQLLTEVELYEFN